VAWSLAPQRTLAALCESTYCSLCMLPYICIRWDLREYSNNITSSSARRHLATVSNGRQATTLSYVVGLALAPSLLLPQGRGRLSKKKGALVAVESSLTS
jgi:hypothetical protein